MLQLLDKLLSYKAWLRSGEKVLVSIVLELLRILRCCLLFCCCGLIKRMFRKEYCDTFIQFLYVPRSVSHFLRHANVPFFLLFIDYDCKWRDGRVSQPSWSQFRNENRFCIGFITYNVNNVCTHWNVSKIFRYVLNKHVETVSLLGLSFLPFVSVLVSTIWKCTTCTANSLQTIYPSFVVLNTPSHYISSTFRISLFQFFADFFFCPCKSYRSFLFWVLSVP